MVTDDETIRILRALVEASERQASLLRSMLRSHEDFILRVSTLSKENLAYAIQRRAQAIQASRASKETD